MTISPGNPVAALCAVGMEREGTPAEALRMFMEAWSIRQDDYDAAIAAHYVARHQPTLEDTLHWNEVAVQHASRVDAARAAELMPSLYLNLGDALAKCGRRDEARSAAERAATSLEALPPGGYRDLVAGGVARLQSRVATDP